MPQPSRRAVLTSAASLTAATARPGPVDVLASPLAPQPSALLLEHLRLAAQVRKRQPGFARSSCRESERVVA